MPKNETPCRNCAERHAGCHASCERYQSWHKEHIEQQRKIRSAYETENMFNTYAIESGERLKKQRRAKK